jgi:hypothetical protein
VTGVNGLRVKTIIQLTGEIDRIWPGSGDVDVYALRSGTA